MNDLYMKLVISLFAIFIISFFFIFKLVYKGNKQEPEDEKINFAMVVFVTFVLALLPTAAIAHILFVLFCSTSAVNMIFSLHLDNNQLIMLAITLLVYLFSIDSLLELLMKHIVGKNFVYYVALFLSRFCAAFVIGKMVNLDDAISVTIAAGVTFIIFLIEIWYHLREKSQEIQVK